MRTFKFIFRKSIVKATSVVSRTCNYACAIMLLGIVLEFFTSENLFHGSSDNYFGLSFIGLMLSVLMEMASGSKGQLQTSLAIFFVPLPLSLFGVLSWSLSPLAYLGMGIMVVLWNFNGVTFRAWKPAQQ